MKPPSTEAAPEGAPGAAPALGSLREIQERFLAELRKGPEEGDDALPASGVFLEPPTESAAARWRIYREGYRLRLVESIRNDYEALARIVGPEPFRALIERYLEAHPPASHDIGRAGDRLAAFLDTDPLTGKLPFLPDLARFEAALAASLVAADPEPVRPERLAALDPLALLDLPLALASGVHLLASEWPLGDLWKLRDQPDSEVAVELYGRPSRLVVYRDGLSVRWRALDDAEAELLRGAARGSTLAELMDSGAFGLEDEAAPLLVSLFLRMIGSAIVQCPSPEAPQRAAVTQGERP
jgi:hypothetical protein